MTKVAIGIITYNGSERLDWLLKSDRHAHAQAAHW